MTLLSIDTCTGRIRKYVNGMLVWNHRFNRLPDAFEVKEMMEI